jgi:hypothetical protein
MNFHWNAFANHRDLAQEVFLTKEEAIASGVEDTWVSSLTGLPVVE